jgi:site-specific DNA-methyltransferase (adenine-specific)
MIINGDCIEEMQKLIDQGVQVDSVVTDPPYHLQSIVDRFAKTSLSDNTKTSERARGRSDGYARMSAGGFMGQEWDGGDIAFRAETWRLAWELLKPGGHLLAFSASRNYHRMAVAIEDAGFEIRDQMMWLYGSGFPKSHNIGKNVDKTLGNVGKNEWEGWGTALKPAHEPIAVGRKPLSESTVAKNVLKHGTGGINIDESRVPHVTVGDGSNLALNSHLRKSINGGNGGKIISTETDRRVVVPDVSGRFPANVMHDGSDAVTSIFPQQTGKGKVIGFGDEGSAARFFYCPKVSKKERGENNKHPTVKPQELMKYLVRLVTPKGGTVLDPFMGSGSTGMAAKDLGFDFIGIEKSEDYFKICQERIEQINPLREFLD